MKFALLVLSFFMLFPVLAKEPSFEQNRFFVQMEKGFQLEAQTNKIKKLFGNTYLVYTNNIAKDLKTFSKKAGVNLIEKSYYAGKRELARPTLETPFVSDPAVHPFDDPKTDRLWAFIPKGDGGMDVSKAYENPMPFTKTEVIVAVVDTGVDYNHEELKEVMWVNEDEIADNGIDDDNNGYIDDIHGIDTLNRNEDGIPSGDPKHDHPHGTHVAGTIAAKQNNGIGITGVASNAKIMAIRAVPSRGDETDVDVVESFLYAAKNGAKIINCSFGKKHNEGGMIVADTIEHIGKEYGTLVVAAAGNDGSNIEERKKYPASFENENLLVVAANKKGGNLASFSNYGTTSVDLAAPGAGILSTIPGNKYSSSNGTSMAAPNAAGVAAEVLSHFPELGPVELKQVLIDSVSREKGQSNRTLSGGIVNLYNALRR